MLISVVIFSPFRKDIMRKNLQNKEYYKDQIKWLQSHANDSNPMWVASICVAQNLRGGALNLYKEAQNLLGEATNSLRWSPFPYTMGPSIHVQTVPPIGSRSGGHKGPLPSWGTTADSMHSPHFSLLNKPWVRVGLSQQGVLIEDLQRSRRASRQLSD